MEASDNSGNEGAPASAPRSRRPFLRRRGYGPPRRGFRGGPLRGNRSQQSDADLGDNAGNQPRGANEPRGGRGRGYRGYYPQYYRPRRHQDREEEGRGGEEQSDVNYVKNPSRGRGRGGRRPGPQSKRDPSKQTGDEEAVENGVVDKVRPIVLSLSQPLYDGGPPPLAV